MILVTGGTGVMGSVLVRRLAEAGERVRVLTLPGDPFVERIAATGAQLFVGDLGTTQGVAGVCTGVTRVYHLAAVILADNENDYRRINVEGTRQLVEEAQRENVRHFVLVSSASVVYPCTTAYSRSKRDAEALVRNAGLPFTIVRPTLVYDRGRGGVEYDLFLSYLNRFWIVPFIGNGRARKRPVFVDDVIDGLVALNGKRDCSGEVLHLSGGETVTMLEFARLSLELMGSGKKPIVFVPVPLCRLLAWVLKRVVRHPPLTQQMITGVTQDADLDPAESGRRIGYSPRGVREMLVNCFPRECAP